MCVCVREREREREEGGERERERERWRGVQTLNYYHRSGGHIRSKSTALPAMRRFPPALSPLGGARCLATTVGPRPPGRAVGRRSVRTGTKMSERPQRKIPSFWGCSASYVPSRRRAVSGRRSGTPLSWGAGERDRERARERESEGERTSEIVREGASKPDRSERERKRERERERERESARERLYTVQEATTV